MPRIGKKVSIGREPASASRWLRALEQSLAPGMWDIYLLCEDSADPRYRTGINIGNVFAVAP